MNGAKIGEWNPPLFFWKRKYWMWMEIWEKYKSYKNCYDVRNINIIYKSWLSRALSNRKKVKTRSVINCSGNVQSQILIYKQGRVLNKSLEPPWDLDFRFKIQNMKQNAKWRKDGMCLISLFELKNFDDKMEIV